MRKKAAFTALFLVCIRLSFGMTMSAARAVIAEEAPKISPVSSTKEEPADRGNSSAPIPAVTDPDGTLSGTRAEAAMRKLMPQIRALLPENNGKWAVYVCDLSTGTASSVDSQPMQAASLIKLFIMGAVFEKYEEIAGEYGTERVEELLHAMITVSDNDAANTLTSYLGGGDPDAGMRAVTEYCAAHGYTDSHMGRLLLHSNEWDDNYTSVRDCGLFLTRVYNTCKRSLSGMPGAEKMYELLKQQTRVNKIPSRLPEGVHVANKTGELGDVENDAGIICDTAKDIDLVVCVMSEDLGSVGNAQNTIAELARFVYDYYNDNNA